MTSAQRISSLIAILTSAIGWTSAAAVPATTAPAATRSIDQYRTYALTHAGDPSAGKALFLDQQKQACAQCHSINGSAARAVPDLFSAGDKFGRQELIETILFPSASIAVGYSTTIVKTKSGEVYEGIIKDSSDAGIVLMGADGKRVRIAAADIAVQRTTDVSLMPEGLQNGLTLQQFADLISYLTTLKVPQTAAATYHGMPPTIGEIQKPIGLVPFHLAEHRFEHPVWFGSFPGTRNAFAVVEHETGRIWVLDKRSAREQKTLFLDVGRYLTGTRGLLGLVFHPKFASNRKYYVARHLVRDGRFATHIIEGEAAADALADSGRPLRDVLVVDDATNVHYGGGLQFGPDGYLYIGMGDSGPQGDPQGHAQNMGRLNGKMLRIDVDHPAEGKLYSIPPDNPFTGRANARPEIWAIGLREPWRFSFDRATGDLWAGDVGQDLIEEVDVLRRGGNYGWNVFEGFERYSNKYRRDGERYLPPVFAYTRKYGNSVTGGYVYRGNRSPSFYGVYIFGDFQSRRVFGLTQVNRTLETVRQIGLAPQQIVSFGEDQQGELYLVGYEGTIFKIDLSDSQFK